MTLDEAIKHCEEVADGMTEQGKCAECAAEHRQLAEWLKELKQLKEQEPCDAISRQAAIDAMIKIEQDDIEQYGCKIFEGFDSDPAIEALEKLPSVTSQPKTGRWIYTLEDWNKWECSECGFTKRTDVHVKLGYDYCPNCGVKIIKETKE